MVTGLLVVAGVLGGAAVAAAVAAPEFLPVAERPPIRAAAVREASGLAVSRRDPGRLWVVNDSGAGAELHAVGIDGAEQGRVTVSGARNVDWEDLASFTRDGKPWLLVADTGDNQARRPECVLYLVEEPELPAGAVRVAREIRFRYAGGPRDCEAVAVDAAGGRILLVSKRTDPPEVHELALDPPAGGGVATTTRVGTLRVAAPAGSLLPFGDQPTGLDIAADGSLAAVVTYHGVFLFARHGREAWAEAFAREPRLLPAHRLVQAESVAVAANGAALFVVSEGRGSPVVCYRRAAPAE